MKFQILIIAFICLAGCTMEGGGVSAEDLNKTVTCTDTRDGETFSFNTNSVTNTRIGIGAPTSFDVTTDDGRKMTINSSMEAWLKCDKAREDKAA